jgi:hypothetical protein
MRMKSLVFTLSIFFVFAANAQKVTFNEDTVLVDEVPQFILIKGKGMSFDFSVKNLKGEDLFFMQFLDFNNPNKISNANPKGRVTYFEFTFFNDKQKCEHIGASTKKGIAKLIVEQNLVKDQQVNQEAENKFVLINGMKFSEEKRYMNN